MRTDSPAYGLKVLTKVAKEFGVSVADLLGKSRARLLVDARMAVVVRLRDLKEPWSYPRLGRLLNRHYSTCINLMQRYEKKQYIKKHL